MKIVYDWLKEYCGEALPDVQTLEEKLTFHAFEIDGVEEMGGRTVLDVKILPDRSSDCLSHRGIAREVSTLTGVPLTHDPFQKTVALTPVSSALRISIADSHACDRFALALVSHITIGESPVWLKERLQALGQRSINNVVDATNYVMLALGQPLHAYDAEKFPHTDEEWHMMVRMAKEAETVTTLSGDEYTLTPQIQLITDGLTGKPAGIAGVKGGKLAEIDTGTTKIILEAGHFDPQITRKGAQALRLQTDASKRFENNPSPKLVPYALTEVVRLITEIAGGVCEGYADSCGELQENTRVTLSLAHLNAILGLTLDTKTVEGIFNRLGFLYVSTAQGWEVTAPWERTDISIPEDVIAEIGRVYGYEHIVATLPSPVPLTEYNARFFYSEAIRSALVNAGCSEVITSSFRKKDTVALMNALASDKGCLRSTLSANLREVLDKNMPYVDLLGISKVVVFEIGTVFDKTRAGDDVTEHLALAIGVRTKQQGYTPKDDSALIPYITVVEEALGVPLMGTTNTGVYECDLSRVLSTLPAPTAYAPYTPQGERTFVPFSLFPFISRDIALWTPEGVMATEVETYIRTHAGPLLTHVRLFDSFSKEGRVSYAFRLIFQSMERTLTDDEVGTAMVALSEALTTQGFEIR
jgi:phenylalanyl-tRNA synthetase beta chain